METEFFLDKPNWGGLINITDHTDHLYLPEMFNYPNVDGAILCITNRPQKKAHLYPIQITLVKDHAMNQVWVISPRTSDVGKGLVCMLADPSTPGNSSVRWQILLLQGTHPFADGTRLS